MRGEAAVSRSRRLLGAFTCLIAGTGINIAGYFSLVPFTIRIYMRAALSAIFLVLLLRARNKPFREILIAFFAVSTGLLIAGLFFADLPGRLGISGDDARGFAVNKIGESLPIIVMIILAVLISRRRLSTLSLGRGKLGWSFFYGCSVGAVVFIYFLMNGGWQIFQPPNFRVLLPVMGWVAVFSIFNSFMEELWFRGLFQSRFETLFGKKLGFWLTVMLFALPHLFGNFSGTLDTWLLLGITVILGIAFGVQLAVCGERLLVISLQISFFCSATLP